MTFRFCVWIWREHHKNTQHSCVPLLLNKEPIDAHCIGFSLFLPTSFVPKWDELQISRPPKFLVGVICIILCPLGFAVEVHVLKFSFNNRQKKLNMTAEMRSAHSTRASLVENQTLPVFGSRLNEHDISASIFEDLYPMSAFLTIRGDNDTPCVCSSPFQRFSNKVLRSPRTIGVGRGRCDLITFLWGQCHGGGYSVNQEVGTLWWICYILAN